MRPAGCRLACTCASFCVFCNRRNAAFNKKNTIKYATENRNIKSRAKTDIAGKTIKSTTFICSLVMLVWNRPFSWHKTTGDKTSSTSYTWHTHQRELWCSAYAFNCFCRQQAAKHTPIFLVQKIVTNDDHREQCAFCVLWIAHKKQTSFF